LLYQADYVPVGDDQRQHIEITRDIVGRFNHLFGEVFTAPQALIRKSGARIMGLDDPTIKMSKSRAEVYDGHAIGLLDPPDKIRRSIMRAVTDSGSTVDPERLSPGVEKLLVLFETLSGASREAVLDTFAGQGYAMLKRQLADLVIAKVTAIQEGYQELRENDARLDGILHDGAERAGTIADLTVASAMRVTGLRY
jgi:tryptophanyl-tRNA synthetase